MPAAPSSIAAAAADAAVGTAWAQWSALTSAAIASAGRTPWSIADPEALVLASLAFRIDERRLGDVLAGWLGQGSRLLSVRRIQTLASSFPHDVADALPWLARLASNAGDRRWLAKNPARPETGTGAEPVRVKAGGPMRLDSGPGLMLRLRAAFGVGAKADVLTFLLGSGGRPATLRAISAATGYTTPAVRTAAEEMTLAGIVEEIAGPPVEYVARAAAWAPLFGTWPPGAPRTASPQLPPWRSWAQVYAFLAGAKAWAREADEQGWSEYVASSRARDLAEKHTPILRRAGISVPATAGRGAEYLDDFAALVQSVGTWAAENL